MIPKPTKGLDGSITLVQRTRVTTTNEYGASGTWRWLVGTGVESSIDPASGSVRGFVHRPLICGFSFASAAAISSQDGARQACQGTPARIALPSALQEAPNKSE